MPEGDTIFRTAARLRPALAGRQIAGIRLRDRQFDPERVVGTTIEAVEARGKHLLMHLSTGGAIHSHLGMTGSWHVYRTGEPWRKPARYAALEMVVGELTVVCFSPKLLEWLAADRLRSHIYLRTLGPDLLDAEFDAAAAALRFRVHDAAPVGEAVMNQTIVCGVGNVYKSEVLFLLGFDPFAAVRQFSDGELVDLVERARRLMRRNLAGGPRQTRFRGDRRRLWVYGRAGEPCYKCGGVIQLRRQGDAGRTTYWCSACQPAR